MNILLLTSHSIAEHDDLDMFTRMGVQVFSIGAYSDPLHPGDTKRPPLPLARHWRGLQAATEEHRADMHGRYGDPGPKIDWAKANIAPKVLDWADTIIVHHFPEQWIAGQWNRIRDKRIIWRTCGQSNPILEHYLAPLRKDGLQIVRYSPKEREFFPKEGAFAGEDVMIRFGKDITEWQGWTGEIAAVGNITQNMLQRGDACGARFWLDATEGLATIPAGPGSEALPGGMGELTYDQMQEYLRRVRVYLYTGTRPASYTLGLMEAMLTGTPVVSMGPGDFEPSGLYEGHEITGTNARDAADAKDLLRDILRDDSLARHMSEAARAKAIDLFDLEKVSREWAAFLGLPVPYEGWTDTTPVWGAA